LKLLSAVAVEGAYIGGETRRECRARRIKGREKTVTRPKERAALNIVGLYGIPELVAAPAWRD
jgi:hypothetical protein